LFERAIEYLGEALAADQSLQIWLDRPLFLEAGEHSTGIDTESVPRVITSRSHNKSGGFVGRMSKLEVKLMVVESAINSILASLVSNQIETLDPKQHSERLLKILARLN